MGTLVGEREIMSAGFRPEVVRRIEKLSKASGIPMSHFLRECVDGYLPTIEGRYRQRQHRKRVTSPRKKK